MCLASGSRALSCLFPNYNFLFNIKVESISLFQFLYCQYDSHGTLLGALEYDGECRDDS